MVKKGNTKLDIVDLGEELIRSRGYHAFSYHDIASRLLIKNAAIHYHFPLKEDLGVAVIKRNTEKFEAMLLDPTFGQFNEWEKLSYFMEEIFGKYLSDDRVCLVGALSTEYPVLPEPIQNEFKEMTKVIRVWLSTLLKEGREKKQFFFSTDAETKALMIITNLIAGLQISRVMNKSDFQLIKDGIIKELRIVSE